MYNMSNLSDGLNIVSPDTLGALKPGALEQALQYHEGKIDARKIKVMRRILDKIEPTGKIVDCKIKEEEVKLIEG